MSLLSVKGLEAAYGAAPALFGVDLDIKAGEVVTLLGRNGMGKTTTVRTIMGLLPATAGRVSFRGKDVTNAPSFQIARMGIGLVPEDRRIIQGLTVQENLELAQIAEPVGWPIELLYERFPRLAERRKQEATTMSGGEQQMLAVARALARNVKLLLLDEPYEGLAPVIVQEIERIVREIKEAGITTIIVEQNAIAALKLADRAVILDSGEVVFDGTAEMVLNDAKLREQYLAI